MHFQGKALEDDTGQPISLGLHM